MRDAGGADAGTKQALESGSHCRPAFADQRLLYLSITGGHGDGWMLSGNTFNLFPSYPGMPDGICDGVEEVRKKVREVLRAGSRHHQDLLHRRRPQPDRSPRIYPILSRRAGRDRAARPLTGAGVKVMSHAQGPGRGQKRRTCRRALHRTRHIPGRRSVRDDGRYEELSWCQRSWLPFTSWNMAKKKGMPEYGLRKVARGG